MSPWDTGELPVCLLGIRERCPCVSLGYGRAARVSPWDTGEPPLSPWDTGELSVSPWDTGVSGIIIGYWFQLLNVEL